MLIRLADKKDCTQIMNLVHELAVYEKAPSEVTVSLNHFIEAGFGQNPVWTAYVAEDDANQIVGFALYYLRYSTWKGTRMYLEDLLVTQAARGCGIGKMLMDKLIEICKEQKYSGLVWQVLEWNEPAINFYKKYEGIKFDKEWVNCSINF